MKSSVLLVMGMIILLFAGALLARDNYLVMEENYTIAGNTLLVNANIDVGEVVIGKNNRDDQCHVYIKYTPERAECDIRYNENNNELDVIVDFENWKKWRDDKDNDEDFLQVLIELPANPEIDLNTDFKAGEFELELGDLKIHNLNFSNWAGEARINFHAPNRIKMNEMDINFKVGELDIQNLGNARFEEADINSGIGEMTVDFSGESLEKAMARLDLDIGETTIIIPNHIGTKLRVSKFLFLSEISYPNWFDKRGSYYYSDNYENSSKFLYLMISTGIGELSIKVD
ncbi:MAG TPA: LiaF-related protein [bacterium]|nr:LiaF-related protein [bacterium]HPN45923.1 LiaF-related protein [bacterium]